MSFVLKEGDLVTLQSGKAYLVVECFEHDGENYYFVQLAPEKIEDVINTTLDGEVLTVKEVLRDGKLILQTVEVKE